MADQATPNPLKRKIAVHVSNLPKFDDSKKFTKFLTSKDVTFSRAKKLSGQRYAEIVFMDEEDKTKCFEKLANIQIDGQTIKLEEKKQFEDRPQRKDNPRPLPDSIQDVVTPWHKIPYEQQLEDKKKEMETVLSDITRSTFKENRQHPPAWVKERKNQPCCPFLGVTSSPSLDGYRNKVEFTYGLSNDTKPTVGFLLGAFKDGLTAVADPHGCRNVSPLALKIRDVYQKILDASPFPTWEKKESKGFWRTLMVRTTELKEALVVVQVNPQDVTEADLVEWKGQIIEAGASSGLLKSIYIQYYEGISNAAPYDCPMIKLWGDDYIHETLCDLRFRISPSAFFQTNIGATEKLYKLVADWCGDLDKKTKVLDICCGTGTIGLSVAKRVNQVIGVDNVESAIEDANHNASINNIDNCTFIAGKAESVLNKAISKMGTLEDDETVVGIVDPPRAGLHPKSIQMIRACEAIQRLVYVSCNPRSLVNDGALFCKPESNKFTGAPFVPVKSMAVDLFPHTPHCELVVLFERSTKQKQPDSSVDVVMKEEPQENKS